MALNKLKEFHVPTGLDEALGLVGQNEDTLILAGGTFLHGLEARGLLSEVAALVDIRKTGLGTVRSDASGLEFGATATFAQLAACDEVIKTPWLGALADALDYPPVQIRNTATVGGCIAASCPFFDVPTAFLALDATVSAKSSSGQRRMPLAELFAGMFANSLEPGEIVAAVALMRPAGKAASAFIKLESNSNDLAIVNAAAFIAVDAGGVCSEVRIALGGGVADTAVRSPAAEALLLGVKPESEHLRNAAEAVSADISPLADHRGSAEYRAAMAKVMVRRALDSAVARLG